MPGCRARMRSSSPPANPDAPRTPTRHTEYLCVIMHEHTLNPPRRTTAPSRQVEQSPQVGDAPDPVDERRRLGRLPPHVDRSDAGRPGPPDIGLPGVPDEHRLGGTDPGDVEHTPEDEGMRLAD